MCLTIHAGSDRAGKRPGKTPVAMLYSETCMFQKYEQSISSDLPYLTSEATFPLPTLLPKHATCLVTRCLHSSYLLLWRQCRCRSLQVRQLIMTSSAHWTIVPSLRPTTGHHPLTLATCLNTTSLPLQRAPQTSPLCEALLRQWQRARHPTCRKHSRPSRPIGTSRSIVCRSYIPKDRMHPVMTLRAVPNFTRIHSIS